MVAIKDALLIKELLPDATVHVLYRDLMCNGVENEVLLRRAKELGVRFISYSKDEPPLVEGRTVKVTADVMGRDFEIPFDNVILATPLVADDGAPGLSRLLKVPLDADRFFLEAHVKLRPVDFSSDGIFVAGTARWPASVRESVEQALGAAARASIPLLAGEVEVEPAASERAPSETPETRTVPNSEAGPLEHRMVSDDRPPAKKPLKTAGWVVAGAGAGVLVAGAVTGSGLANGTVTVFCPSATSAVTTLEYESGCISDLQRLFDEIVDPARHYAHNARWGDGNGHSHVQAALMGPSITLPLRSGKLRLGTWQQVVATNHDNRPRKRTIEVTVTGTAK